MNPIAKQILSSYNGETSAERRERAEKRTQSKMFFEVMASRRYLMMRDSQKHSGQ